MQGVRRSALYMGMMDFFDNLFDKLQLAEVKVWVNGSFSTKKPNPADIDIVYFLDDTVVKEHELILAKQFSYPESLELYGIDAYLVRVFDKAHEHFARTQSDQMYWLHQFTRTRKNRRGISYRKGFLEINIRKDEIR